MTPRSLYPLFLKLDDAPVLVVGGGVICAQKLPPLVHAGARIEIVAPTLDAAVQAFVDRGEATHRVASFVPADVTGARVVIAATDDEATNRQVYDAAKAAGILVNVVDVPALCDFYTGGIVRRGPLTIVIGSSGKAPGLSRALREHLEHLLPAALTPLAALVGEGRKRAPKLWSTFEARAPRLTQLARVGLCYVMDAGGDHVSAAVRERVTLAHAAVVTVDFDAGLISAARAFGDVFEDAPVDVAKITKPEAAEIVRVLTDALTDADGAPGGRYRCTLTVDGVYAESQDSGAGAEPDAEPRIARSGTLTPDLFAIVYDSLVPLVTL